MQESNEDAQLVGHVLSDSSSVCERILRQMQVMTRLQWSAGRVVNWWRLLQTAAAADSDASQLYSLVQLMAGPILQRSGCRAHCLVAGPT